MGVYHWWGDVSNAHRWRAPIDDRSALVDCQRAIGIANRRRAPIYSQKSVGQQRATPWPHAHITIRKNIGPLITMLFSFYLQAPKTRRIIGARQQLPGEKKEEKNWTGSWTSPIGKRFNKRAEGRWPPRVANGLKMETSLRDRALFTYGTSSRK